MPSSSEKDFAVVAPMLPRHDDIGPARRILEGCCIAAAAGLWLVQATRFIVVPSSTPWWSLPLVALGIAAADFLSGLIHWTADTWGSETMPILGRRLLHPFRVHHVNPDDFLRRQFLDTNGDVAIAMLPFLSGMFWIPLETAAGQCVAALLLGFCGIGLWANQAHQWAHMPRPPRLVRLLQDCRLLLSHRVHQRHHRPPHVTDYCIVTGWCNGLLNRMSFFQRLERAVTLTTGFRPREDDANFGSATAGMLGAPVMAKSGD
jgi:plasmanylethanolamine desaturase